MTTDTGIGKPIVILAAGDSNGTLIGTSGIGGEVDGVWREVPYSNIQSVHGVEVYGSGSKVLKADMDTLEVIRTDGQYLFKTSPGENLFCLLNIVRRLAAVSA